MRTRICRDASTRWLARPAGPFPPSPKGRKGRALRGVLQGHDGDERPGAFGSSAGFPIGARIAGYRLEEQIGHGGMAVVFRAEDERLQRQVALKILAPALATDEAFRTASFVNPGLLRQWMTRTSSRCSSGDADGVLFIAMRYVPGGGCGDAAAPNKDRWPLRALLASYPRWPQPWTPPMPPGWCTVMSSLANMLVDARPGRPDHVYLSDFGLTKAALSSVSLTRTGHVLGTLNYCAPEQIQGCRVYARTDDSTHWRARSMRCSQASRHFPGDEGAAVLYAHLSTPPPPLTSRRPGLSLAVNDVLLHALAKAPEGRYPSCGEFADALRGALGLQRYDSDVAIALHERSLVDQQTGWGWITRTRWLLMRVRWRPARRRGVRTRQSHYTSRLCSISSRC